MKLLVLFISIFCSGAVYAQTTEFVKIENQIRDHIAHGRWDEVLLMAPDLLIEEPTRGEGYYYTAMAFLRLDQPDKAREYVDKADLMADAGLGAKIKTLKEEISTAKRADQIQNNAESKEKGGSKKLAADEWAKLWQMDQSKKEYALNAVELYVEAKRYEEAMQILTHASMKNDDGVAQLIQKLNKTPEMIAVNGYNAAMQSGKKYFDNGSYQSALKSFETALSHKSNDPDAVSFKRKSQDEIAWEKARSTNTIESYENYAYGSTLKKYKSRALGIIERTLISWGEEYAAKNDVSQTETYLKKYLSDFPDGDDRIKATGILCNLYVKNAKAYSKDKTYYGQKQANDFYGRAKNTCLGTNSFAGELKTTSKLMKRYGRPNRTYIAYTYDSITPIGLSIGGLKNRKLGMYLGVRVNNDFLTKSTYFTVDNGGNYTGTSLTDIRYKGEKRYGQGEAVLGLTKKIAYPLWVYGGGGVALNQQWIRVDSYYSSGNFNETAWVRNTDEQKLRPLAEAGLILDISGLHLRGGVKSIDFQNLHYNIGIGFSVK